MSSVTSSVPTIGAAYTRESAEQADQFERLRQAAAAAGIKVVPLGGADTFLRASCDFVLALDVDQPKSGDLPSYVLLNQPIARLASSPARLRTILSHDGFLSLDPGIQQWAASLAMAMGKTTAPTAFFDITACRTPVEATLGERRIAYAGPPEPGEPYRPLLALLRGLPNAVLSEVGPNAQALYRQCGLGLCLTDPDMADGALAPRALFDILAAGALGVVVGTRFLRERFGNLSNPTDTLLFLDEVGTTLSLMAQVRRHMAWVHDYPDEGLARARAAKEIFDRQFAIEALLPNLLEMHREAGQAAARRSTAQPPADREVAVILRTGPDSTPASLRRVIKMLAEQTHRKLRVFAVEGEPQSLKGALDAFPELRVSVVPPTPNAADASLGAVAEQLDSEFFMFVDDGNEWSPDHVASLIAAFRRSDEENSGAVLAHCGVVERRTAGPSALLHFEPKISLIQPPPPGAWMARSFLLDAELRNNPDFAVIDDQSMARMLFAKGRSVFTGQVTCSVASDELPLPAPVTSQLDLVGGTTLGRNLVPGADLVVLPEPKEGEGTASQIETRLPDQHEESPTWARVASDARPPEWLVREVNVDNLIGHADLKDYANWWIKDILVTPPPSEPNLAPVGKYRVVIATFPIVWVAAGTYCLFIKLLARKEQRRDGFLFGCDILGAAGELIKPAVDFVATDGYDIGSEERGFRVYRLQFDVKGAVTGLRIRLWNFDNAELLVRSVRVYPWPQPAGWLVGRELRCLAVADEGCSLGLGSILVRGSGERPAVLFPIRSARGKLRHGKYRFRLKLVDPRPTDPSKPLFSLDVCGSNGEFLMFRKDAMLANGVPGDDGSLDFELDVDIRNSWKRYGDIHARLLCGSNGELQVRSAMIEVHPELVGREL